MDYMAVKSESNSDTNSEMDSTNDSASVSSLQPINISPTSSLHDGRVLSPALSHAALPEDLPLQNSSLPTLRDSPILRNRSLSISVEPTSQSSTDDTVADLEKYVRLSTGQT